ncbi:CPA2 family monovalent cation:H+ antiporter-2 [Ammoniphilus resinae]|uniref:CPA2 family monovalent cation:H+ antiporter-2 n=1 Tax=Ammoniphilus resinae TaxID=861532 RepID=A0ABS4GQ56_9BACL|nr:cation:proton antiporter [Ammoniphilus resinae]MBP1932376.1 CPA2 family monovalent cation:H+ antiporter-2 [Ammoniphilus resinae]
MIDPLVLEVGTALVLVSLAAVLAGRFKFSVIPFFILIGMIVGPHAPSFGTINFQFIASSEIIHFFGRVGVLFLLFYLGIEFSVSKIIRSGRNIAVGGSIHVLMNFGSGLLFGYLLGFPLAEILIIAGMFTVTSSAIIAKVLVDYRRTANPETELILGIVMFDDLFLAVYLSLISGLVLGESTSLMGTLGSVAIAFGYMLLFFIIARKGTSLLNRLLNVRSDEIFILIIFGSLFFVAGFSETIHVAEAVGALLLGLVYSETEHRERIERLIVPFRDFFGAFFFFSFGLGIDPFSLGEAIWLALGAVLITIIINITAGLIAGRNAGLSYKASSNIGLTIVSRGELTIVVANLGIAAGLLPIIKPFSALYVLILASIGPILTKESKNIYNLAVKILPTKKKKVVEQKSQEG